MTVNRTPATILSLLLLTASFGRAADSSPGRSARQTDGGSKLADLPGVKDVPSWLTVSGQIRGRIEFPAGIGYSSNSSDFYYANRLRLDLGVRVNSWTRGYFEFQDSRLAGYNQGQKPTSMYDPADIHQMWAEVGRQEGGIGRVRFGRMELKYADGWLVSASDWGNVSRVFDGGRISTSIYGFNVDGFAASVVLADAGRLDRHKPGEHLYGSYWSNPRVIPHSTVDAFMMARTQDGVTGETGGRGDATIYMAGGRALGQLPYRFDYATLWARQWGSYGPDAISAWAGYADAGWTVNGSKWKPRISSALILASGDSNSRDRVRSTFDQFYGGLHYFLGAADRVGWRNSRNIRVGVNFSPSRKWKVFCDLHDYSLLTVKDGLYNASGTREVLSTNARSRHVGVEYDTYFTYQVSGVTAVGAGIGHLRPGAYLRGAGKTGCYTFPYVMLTRKF